MLHLIGAGIVAAAAAAAAELRVLQPCWWRLIAACCAGVSHETEVTWDTEIMNQNLSSGIDPGFVNVLVSSFLTLSLVMRDRPFIESRVLNFWHIVRNSDFKKNIKIYSPSAIRASTAELCAMRLVTIHVCGSIGSRAKLRSPERYIFEKKIIENQRYQRKECI